MSHSLSPPPLCTRLFSAPEKQSHLLFATTGVLSLPTAHGLEGTPRWGSPRPTVSFPLQVSSADERRRTLTPLALRYSILSEPSLGINLFTGHAPCLSRRL